MFTLEIKHYHESKSLKFYDASTKAPPYYSQLFPVIGDQSLYFQPFEHRILTNGTILYASDFAFLPLRKNMLFSITDINNIEYPYQTFIQILIQNRLNHPLTQVKGLIGYAEQDVSLNDLQTTKYRFNELTEFMDAYTSNYLWDGTSDTLKNFIA